jgi:hypothetical protein
LLQRLAGQKGPVVAFGKDDEGARKQLRDAWQAWWKDHGAAVNIQVLKESRGSSGLTLVLQRLMPAAGKGVPLGGNRLVAIDRSGHELWQMDNLESVVDFQLLPGNRVLMAEYTTRRVTERDLKGNILWEAPNLGGLPVNVQRLPNGNTFVVLYGPAPNAPLMELDSKGAVVAAFKPPVNAGGMVGPAGAGGFGGKGGLVDYVTAAHRMPDGKMVCLMYDGSCVLLDATGKETKRFVVPAMTVTTNSLGGIDVTRNGNVLFAQTNNDMVEYDLDGKTIWQTKITGYRASRLANGNTLVLTGNRVAELDTGGREVWHYDLPPGAQGVRARRQ